jgi:hypothetical protein
MSTSKPSLLVVSFSPDDEAIKIQSMDAAAIDQFKGRKLTFPVFFGRI